MPIKWTRPRRAEGAVLRTDAGTRKPDEKTPGEKKPGEKKPGEKKPGKPKANQAGTPAGHGEKEAK